MAEPSPDAAERKRQLAREAQRRYREKNPGKVRERQRQYREANREKIREGGREYGRRIREEKRDDPAWQEQRREYARAYREANKPKIRELNRQYYQQNRDALLDKQREYNKANSGRRREYMRRYLAENGDAVREKDRQRRRENRETYRDRNRTRVHGLSADQWAAMWTAQDGCCYLCRKPMQPDDAVVEHWHGCSVPHGKSTSCRYCHRGLAHNECNAIIGLAYDDPDLLRMIADNLEAANADVKTRQTGAPVQLGFTDME